jgi:hypothetical protein
MEDILDIEEVAEQAHSSECFCQLCQPYLGMDQEETGVASTALWLPKFGCTLLALQGQAP